MMRPDLSERPPEDDYGLRAAAAAQAACIRQYRQATDWIERADRSTLPAWWQGTLNGLLSARKTFDGGAVAEGVRST